ncbi:OLC1v1024556C1 [Oldenlandia corymbosa var. corymbosa]|uniref:OLC1v1024556C1 n=1 Tax=Oldenlandia corymbosa var. corymbosa TaxID=529605 RepID=A0AAV1C5H0_OLDCO|nr:OLC1v1024556C1 [Oldenlandia corymbosa var. corymbosa]
MEPIDEEAEFDIGFEVNGSETDAANDVEVSINGGTDTTGTQEGDEAAPANKGGRKKRRLTSSVWHHFRILPQKPNEKLHCECKKCGKKYLAGSENGTLADFKAALFALYDEYLLASPSNQASSSCSSGSNNEHRRETEGSHTSTLMMVIPIYEPDLEFAEELSHLDSLLVCKVSGGTDSNNNSNVQSPWPETPSIPWPEIVPRRSNPPPKGESNPRASKIPEFLKIFEEEWGDQTRQMLELLDDLRNQLVLSKFSENETKAWLQNCNEYFSILSIPESDRLEMIKPYLEDVAEIWLEAMMMLKPNITWLEVSNGFIKRLEEKMSHDEIDLGSEVSQTDSSLLEPLTSEEGGNTILSQVLNEMVGSVDDGLLLDLGDNLVMIDSVNLNEEDDFVFFKLTDEILTPIDNLRMIFFFFFEINDDEFLTVDKLSNCDDDNNVSLEHLVHDSENLNGASAALMSSTVSSCDEDVSNMNLVGHVALEDDFLFMHDIVFLDLTDEIQIDEDWVVDSEFLKEEGANAFLVCDALLSSDDDFRAFGELWNSNDNARALLEKVVANSMIFNDLYDDPVSCYRSVMSEFVVKEFLSATLFAIEPGGMINFYIRETIGKSVHSDDDILFENSDDYVFCCNLWDLIIGSMKLGDSIFATEIRKSFVGLNKIRLVKKLHELWVDRVTTFRRGTDESVVIELEFDDFGSSFKTDLCLWVGYNAFNQLTQNMGSYRGGITSERFSKKKFQLNGILNFVSSLMQLSFSRDLNLNDINPEFVILVYENIALGMIVLEQNPTLLLFLSLVLEARKWKLKPLKFAASNPEVDVHLELLIWKRIETSYSFFYLEENVKGTDEPLISITTTKMEEDVEPTAKFWQPQLSYLYMCLASVGDQNRLHRLQAPWDKVVTVFKGGTIFIYYKVKGSSATQELSTGNYIQSFLPIKFGVLAATFLLSKAITSKGNDYLILSGSRNGSCIEYYMCRFSFNRSSVEDKT